MSAVLLTPDEAAVLYRVHYPQQYRKYVCVSIRRIKAKVSLPEHRIVEILARLKDLNLVLEWKRGFTVSGMKRNRIVFQSLHVAHLLYYGGTPTEWFILALRPPEGSKMAMEAVIGQVTAGTSVTPANLAIELGVAEAVVLLMCRILEHQGNLHRDTVDDLESYRLITGREAALTDVLTLAQSTL